MNLVGACPLCLRDCISALCPNIASLRLTDYKVLAMVGATLLELLRLNEHHESEERAVEDYCWNV